MNALNNNENNAMVRKALLSGAAGSGSGSGSGSASSRSQSPHSSPTLPTSSDPTARTVCLRNTYLFIFLTFQLAYAVFFYQTLSSMPESGGETVKQVTYPLTSDQSRIHFLNSLRPFSHVALSAYPLAYESNMSLLSHSRNKTRPNEFTLEKRFVFDYIRYHEKNRYNASAKFLIFRPFKTGVGDRIHRFMIAYYLAAVSKRILLIDWTAPFPIEKFLETADKRTDFFLRPSDDRIINIRTGKGITPNNRNVIQLQERNLTTTSKERNLTTTSKERNLTTTSKERNLTTTNKEQNLATTVKNELDLQHIVVLDDMPSVKHVMVRTLVSDSPNFRVVALTMTAAISSDMLADLAQRMISDLHPRFVTRFVNEAHCRRSIMTKILRLSDDVLDELESRSNLLGLKPAFSHAETSSKLLTKTITKHNSKDKKTTVRRPYIGVHIRLGKGLGERGTRFERSAKDPRVPARCLASRAVRMSFMVGEPPLPIFLATDTPSVRREFEKAVIEAAHGRIQVMYGNWNIVHSRRYATAAGNWSQRLASRSRESVKWTGMWDSFLDLALLGHAKHVLALYSSYARMAFSVGTADSLIELRNEVCLDTERWV